MWLDVLDRLSLWVLRALGFRRRFVDTPVGRIHVLDAPGRGDGPPIVVLHGICAASAHFARVLPRLRGYGRRVIALDLPGHGASDVPAAGITRDTLTVGISAALDAVIDEPFLFFGNSLGGAAAIRYALAKPERVCGLMLSSPGGAAMAPDALSAFLDGFRLDDVGRAADFVGRLYARPPWFRRLIAGEVRRRFLAPPLRRFVDTIGPDDLFRPEELANLRMPVRLCWGRHDALMPREHLAFFRAHLPGHARIDEPACGHCPYLDAPADLARDIGAFARELAR